MPLRLAPVILANVMLFCVCAVAEQSPGCPATLDVREQASKPPAGWSVIYDDAPHQLVGITFYDGPPKENASLVYDDITKNAGKQAAQWRFAQSAGRPIWMACRYAGTAMVLAKALPGSVSGCTVIYDAREQIAGEPVIQTISCK